MKTEKEMLDALDQLSAYLNETDAFVRKFKLEYDRKRDWDWADTDIPVELTDFMEELFDRLL